MRLLQSLRITTGIEMDNCNKTTNKTSAVSELWRQGDLFGNNHNRDMIELSVETWNLSNVFVHQ